MNEQSTNPTENELPDDIIRQAIASIQEGSVPAGPPPELIAATQDVLKYPFRSRQVRDICKHLTPDESRRLTASGWKTGLVGGILIHVILYSLLFLWLWLCTPFYPPYPSIHVVLFIAVPVGLLVGLLVGWGLHASVRKKQRLMLCETGYAKQMGFTPDTLPFYDFSNKELLILPIGAFIAVMVLCLLLYGLVIPNYGDSAAGKIVDRMAGVYANCKTYRDTGMVTTRYFMKKEEGGNWTKKHPFTTAFVRGDRFRFEYKEKMELLPGMKQGRRIIWSNWKDVKPWWNFWSNGYEVQTWWDIKPGVEKPTRLDYALAGAPTASIPKQLFRRDVWFPVLTQITDAKLADDGQLDGVECYRVEGKYGTNWKRLTLWIDKKSYLVRRIDEQYESNPPQGNSVRVEETTTYDPVVDETIADKLLEFDPPVKK